jgi:hypothetical protein
VEHHGKALDAQTLEKVPAAVKADLHKEDLGGILATLEGLQWLARGVRDVQANLFGLRQLHTAVRHATGDDTSLLALLQGKY